MTDSETRNIKDLEPSSRATIYLAVLVHLHGKFAERLIRKDLRKIFNIDFRLKFYKWLSCTKIANI